eukprot:GHVQ01018006.1.p1 GENE.GHVQ01018006.1~~GHVQ01018006.1.p1  ORF type:complete len:165 (-),score=11.36 GHVQ01018006.1:169-663(-)
MKYSSMTALGLSVGCLMTCISPASAGIESMGTLVDDGGQIRPPSLSENLRLWQEHRKHLYLGPPAQQEHRKHLYLGPPAQQEHRKHLYLGPPAQGCEIDQGTSLLGNRTHSNEPVCDNIVGCEIDQGTSLLGNRTHSNEPVCDNIVGCAIGQRTSLLGKRKRSN